MLRTSPVRQSSPPRISPHRTGPSQPATQRQTATPFWQRSHVVPFLVSVFFCLAGIGVYIWPRVQVVRLAYRLQASEQRLSALVQEQDQLRLELAALKDPQRIYQVATDQLGLSLPAQEQVFTVTRDLTAR
jgi:cell division protein FtsL